MRTGACKVSGGPNQIQFVYFSFILQLHNRLGLYIWLKDSKYWRLSTAEQLWFNKTDPLYVAFSVVVISSVDTEESQCEEQ